MHNDIWAIFKQITQDDSISMAEQHANWANMTGASTRQIIQTTFQKATMCIC